jgi:hypothetical protein
MDNVQLDDGTVYHLRNDAPKRKPKRYDNAENTRQGDLFLGLHDLPGQQYLIENTNGWSDGE